MIIRVQFKKKNIPYNLFPVYCLCLDCQTSIQGGKILKEETTKYTRS